MIQNVRLKLNPDCRGKRSIQEEEVSFHQQKGRKFKEEFSEVLHFEHSCVTAETWTLRKVDQKYLENFEVWCWRRMRLLDRSQLKWGSIVWSQVRDEYFTYNKRKEG
jgi:predicted oxidoreductase (fatty acid repression mutant protein)